MLRTGGSQSGLVTDADVPRRHTAMVMRRAAAAGLALLVLVGCGTASPPGASAEPCVSSDIRDHVPDAVGEATSAEALRTEADFVEGRLATELRDGARHPGAPPGPRA